MTPPSAESRAAGRRAQSGFTLLEVMVALGIVGFALMGFLEVRSAAAYSSWKSQMDLDALRHCHERLAELMLDPDEYAEQAFVVEDAPAFRYVLTVEEYDLSTGRESDDEETDVSGGFSNEFESGFSAMDYGGEEQDDNPHLVRRVKIVMLYPDLENDDQDQQLVLETYLPRVTEDVAGSLLGGPR